ncbi:SH3 domain-containing protein Dlish-like [Amphibalanus amphitrite]|uniref:SH3 domain-containing protein Dlish-like n=1 Tax=Amphibalanus amphitrite TaxID=1232801 RepID=UPI001C927026|nr:SH3 domain-containing protein Dlish-like [Amphibalanus amphitrite]
MAFLCPVRIRRNKKKKSNDDTASVRTPGMGRITGSSSIETLVRVGIEKENGLSADSKMVVLHDFTPCVDDELEVKRGTVVNVLYQENDWVYVISESSQQEGFIPHSYCAPHGSQLADLALSVKKKLPRELTVPDGSGAGPGGGGGEADHNTIIGNASTDRNGVETSDNDSFTEGGRPEPRSTPSGHSGPAPDVHPFFKDPAGRYIVLYTFMPRDENDVSVERGEFVTVLNKEDHEWFWIERSDGQEGFVPSAFVYPADVLPGEAFWSRTTADPPRNKRSPGGDLGPGGSPPTHQQFPSSPGGHGGHHMGSPGQDDPRFHGTELVMLYDYKAQAPDDLSVRRGDWIYADLNNQTVDGWLWAYSPKSRKHGFIPKAYARPPAMTSL